MVPGQKNLSPYASACTTGFAMYDRNLIHLQPYLILYHTLHQYTKAHGCLIYIFGKQTIK